MNNRIRPTNIENKLTAAREVGHEHEQLECGEQETRASTYGMKKSWE